jgi:outer membrane receptor protein involved in Fe transport
VSSLWPAATQIVLARLRGVVSAQDSALLAAFLPTLAPTAADIAGRMALLNPTTRAFDPVTEPVDIDALRPTKNRTIEIGYKGILQERLQVSADLYWSHMRDFIGPMLIFTPNVFMDAQQTTQYLQPRLKAAIEAGLISKGLPPDIADHIADSIAAKNAPMLGAGYGQIPLGTVTPEGVTDPTGIMVSSKNYGEVDITGFDLSANYRISSEWSVEAAGSWTGRTFFGLFDFENEGESPPFNAPELRGSVSVEYRNEPLGFHAEARVRHADGFVMQSGVYEGFVPSYNLVDASAGYRIPGTRRVDLTLSATNVLGHDHIEFIGGAMIGRTLTLRAGVAF